MRVIYARQVLPERGTRGFFPNSIFLVGPTPRDKNVKSWRPEALERLKNLEFTGTVFVPEDEGWETFDPENHREQIWWEIGALGGASTVVVWLDRQLPDMPAFTTNTEIGLLLMAKPERLVFGVPESARKTGYQRELAGDVRRLFQAFGGNLPTVAQVPVCVSMQDMLANAVEMAKS